jgi:phage host-nuclease inhibitor protein Gam
MTESNLPDCVTRLETMAEVTLLAIQQLGVQQREMQKTLTDSIQDLLGMMNEQRGDMAEMQSEIRGLQRENRQILDILLNRQNPDA